MRRLFSAFLVALTVALLMPASVGAASEARPAQVYVVHGIPGADVSPDLPASLPVDVSVNGGCALTNFTFGTIAGPLALPAGDYTVAISVANPANPCGNAPVIGPATINLGAGENASIVAHLTENGGLTASKFTNDASRVRGNKARVIVHHTAKAPLVDICVVPRNGMPKLTLSSVGNGAQGAVEVQRGNYYVDIAPAGSDQVVFGPVNVSFKPRTITLVYAVGSLDKGTFTLLTKTI